MDSTETITRLILYVCIIYCQILDVTSNEAVVEGTVRLVNGSSPHKGRVEIFLLGKWGTVCGDTWDLFDATVLCKELGYLRAVSAPRYAAIGTGSGPPWYSYCLGNESSLYECTSSYYYYCHNLQDAGVVCSGESLQNVMQAVSI